MNDRLTLRGTVDSDPDEDHRVPMCVINGREISWDELGRMVATIGGWQFKLESRDRSEEVCPGNRSRPQGAAGIGLPATKHTNLREEYEYSGCNVSEGQLAAWSGAMLVRVPRRDGGRPSAGPTSPDRTVRTS